jgi:hypothetical protein
VADSDDVIANIPTSALQPRRASGDSGSMEQHSLPDQIAAAKFAASTAALKASRLGYRRVQLRPGNNADLERHD